MGHARGDLRLLRHADRPGAEEYREPLAHRTGELLGGCRPRFWEALAGSFGERSASLYGYVSSKDEMYDLMVDWVDGEDGPPSSTER